jgi:internalin A
MTDSAVISQIEAGINVSLKPLTRLLPHHPGYVLNSRERVTALSLTGCPIPEATLTQIARLTRLETLNLSGCRLTTLAPLDGLTALTTLYLSHNQINNLAPLDGLTALTTLYLGHNRISDPAPLAQLTGLRVLYLNNNHISRLNALTGLKSLMTLRLDYNRITGLQPLTGLDNLESLRMDGNNFRSVTHLAGLKSLKGLRLSHNRITSLKPLAKLTGLTSLDLRHNRIEQLPPEFANLPLPIRWEEEYRPQIINLAGNPITEPPPDIIRQGNAAIQSYTSQLAGQQQGALLEAKLLILGEAGAGKTSLAWKIENPDCALPTDDDSTHGIDVGEYCFEINPADFPDLTAETVVEREFRVNLWDFAGQHIYVATHRFFLSRRALYILVADERKLDTDFNYWLNIIKLLGGDSPLLIVLNEKQGHKRQIDPNRLRERFPNIKDILSVDLADEDHTRLDILRRAIHFYVTQLQHIGDPVPSGWVDIRDAIEEDDHNTISRQDYLAICRDNGITNTPDALVLSQYFHDIGVFLHFENDVALKHTLFLKPNWVTSAVYKLFDHPLLSRQQGRFNRADANIIWAEAQYSDVRDELLRLMQKFFLAYRIGDSGEYIVPEQLPVSKPDYPWPAGPTLLQRYKYDYFMPRGIISRFTVSTHHYIANHNYVWQSGVVLVWNEITAEVIENSEERVIEIRVNGQEWRNRNTFMTLIIDHLDRVNSKFNNLRAQRMIPCTCATCRSGEKPGTPGSYGYNELQRLKDAGIADVLCFVSLKNVRVNDLIHGILQEDEAMTMTDVNPRDKVFISYAHKDKEWLPKIQTRLKALGQMIPDFTWWDDTKIEAGDTWRNEIRTALDSTKVAILLISNDFLASNFIAANELPPLLKAAEAEGATVLMVILKPSLIDMHPELPEYQMINSPGTPLSGMTENEQDQVLNKLARRVAKIIKDD